MNFEEFAKKFPHEGIPSDQEMFGPNADYDALKARIPTQYHMIVEYVRELRPAHDRGIAAMKALNASSSEIDATVILVYAYIFGELLRTLYPHFIERGPVALQCAQFFAEQLLRRAGIGVAKL